MELYPNLAITEENIAYFVQNRQISDFQIFGALFLIYARDSSFDSILYAIVTDWHNCDPDISQDSFIKFIQWLIGNGANIHFFITRDGVDGKRIAAHLLEAVTTRPYDSPVAQKLLKLLCSQYKPLPTKIELDTLMTLIGYGLDPRERGEYGIDADYMLSLLERLPQGGFVSNVYAMGLLFHHVMQAGWLNVLQCMVNHGWVMFGPYDTPPLIRLAEEHGQQGIADYLRDITDSAGNLIIKEVPFAEPAAVQNPVIEVAPAELAVPVQLVVQPLDFSLGRRLAYSSSAVALLAAILGYYYGFSS